MSLEKLKKMFQRQKPIQAPQPQRNPQPRKKSCKRIIKRDDEGRVKEERFEGCSPQEIKMMREQGAE